MTTSEHAEPTPATVKRLYARAFRCARPGCSRPLYTLNNDTGEVALNSRVAHIHARRPGGPRWINMSATDNRADTNLLLLCIEHSYEIDEFPDSYSPELLRSWKQAQLDEYEEAERGWPISDAEAGRVLEASLRAVEQHYSGAVLGAVRAAERLALTARDARRGPATRAAAWRAARARARRGMIAWDANGDTLLAEPSRHETEQLKATLLAALEAAAEALAPLATDAKVELAAVRASRTSVEPWSAWASRAVDEVVRATLIWPGPPGLEDDDQLEDALSELAAATGALAAAWRGEPAAQPPPEPDPEPSPDLHDPLHDYRVLLDRARPYSRVDHRTYDGTLRAELGDAAEQAAGIPPVMSALGVDLTTTCRLAAAVAGNATDDELAALAEQDACRRPYSAAVLLLAEAARAAEKRGRRGPQDQAAAALAALWESIDWSDPDSWDVEDANTHVMFWEGSRLTSPDDVQERLSEALSLRPEVVLPLVTACAGWEESRDSEDWSLIGFRRRYHNELPAWFPVRAVVSAAASSLPNVTSAGVDAFGDTSSDTPESLLAQVLWLADRAATT